MRVTFDCGSGHPLSALAAKRRRAIKRNMSLLPAYSILLTLIALFGYFAIADPVTVANVKKSGHAQLAIP